MYHVNSDMFEQGARIRASADEMDVSLPVVSVPTTTTTGASDVSSSKSIAECRSATSTDVVVSALYGYYEYVLYSCLYISEPHKIKLRI